MSDFQTKDDLADVGKLLSQEHDVAATIAEPEIAPELRAEPLLGPVPKIAPEIDHKPDPSALAAWVDDLSDYADKHRGEEKASRILDRIASLDLDDLQDVAREHLEEEVNAADEQFGMVPDFHADSAIDGGAQETHGAAEPDLLAPMAGGPGILQEDAGFNGSSGGGGGAGGGTPLGDSDPGEGGDAAGDGKPKPDKAAAKADKKAEAAKPAAPQPKPEAKPDKAKPDKKRDGDR